MNTNLKQLVKQSNTVEFQKYVHLNPSHVGLFYKNTYLFIFNNETLTTQESVKMRLVKYVIST